jgi:hypothetical protein
LNLFPNRKAIHVTKYFTAIGSKSYSLSSSAPPRNRYCSRNFSHSRDSPNLTVHRRLLHSAVFDSHSHCSAPPPGFSLLVDPSSSQSPTFSSPPSTSSPRATPIRPLCYSSSPTRIPSPSSSALAVSPSDRSRVCTEILRRPLRSL